MIKYYKVVAYRNEARWVVGKFIKTLEDAERMQRRFYVANPGTDYYIE